MTALSARAEVTTAKPDRYAKQLVSHLGRKLAFTTTGRTSVASIGTCTGTGTGSVIAGNRVLTLVASAPDAESLDVVKHVLGSHLERFGARDGLRVEWAQR